MPFDFLSQQKDLSPYCFISGIFLADINAGPVSDSFHILGGHCVASVAFSGQMPRGRKALYYHTADAGLQAALLLLQPGTTS